ncbi:hypothetical protein [Enhydrobacter sp.]|jgi:phosphotransferase system  glucose/maltose/N-acetylglucosamine-specific IIC component|uniref:hypothetical protein n=1 Tax=Enhydrobacter sp. TaxID=1894999 RepID=UPI0026263DA4|nr:hypothetical protein [Enhydrobacter sp.]WIM09236.1 MAG: hypothetical protein OJF58_000187 [Enhydrobacter sp.]
MSVPYGTVPGPAEVGSPVAPMALGQLTGVVKRVSWPAIFSGVVLVLAVEVLLDMLGAGIGLGLVNPGGDTPDARGLGIGAGLWWFASTVIALLFGCYVAARLAGVATRFDGALHGLVIWGLALLITIYLLSTAVGSVIGGAFTLVGDTVSAAGKGLAAAAPQVAQAAGVTPEMVQRQAEAYLQPTNPDPATMSPQDAQKEIARAIPDLGAGGARADQARDRIVTIMAGQLKIGKEEAAQRFDEAQARLVQTRDSTVRTARNVADRGAAAASRASLWAFAALLIGAIAAAIGGALASPRLTARPVVDVD